MAIGSGPANGVRIRIRQTRKISMKSKAINGKLKRQYNRTEHRSIEKGIERGKVNMGMKQPGNVWENSN